MTTKETYNAHRITATQNANGLWTLKINGELAKGVKLTQYTSLDRGLKAARHFVDMQYAHDNWDRKTYRGKYAR